ncbi:hypothetical protein GCM10009535_12370 [Streptomyces thermocarboxydovorans]|uniref:Uncharacterized protein n=1 Tax=Streptomyces thermocarboxydovorans TaxID=59298 RepID=A0ABP3SGB1_9ACTN
MTNQTTTAELPAWEALYEPGNVSTYLIGYANDQDAATGMAEAWMRSQAEVTGRLEWVDDTQMATGRYDRWFELIECHGDGVDTGTSIVVRRRVADDPAPAAVSAAVAPPTTTTHGLSVQHADALWDAVAIPGPRTATYPEQHERVCRAVREILDELTPARADAVLAVLPEPADRAAIYAEVAERLATDAEQGDKDGLTRIYRRSAAKQVREWADRLRRMADETATEHRPAVSRWRVETLDNLANEWAPGTGWPVRALAVERFDAMNAQAPRWKDGTPVTRRLVRETTTYTVEAEHQPAAGARQDGAES